MILPNNREGKKLAQELGKKEFYPKAREALESEGYKYYDGDKDIKGKTCAWARKPDYMAQKGKIVVFGENKSPKEVNNSSSWWRPQRNDSKEMIKVREDASAKVKTKKFDKNIVKHEIIIKGQIPDYVKRLGTTYDSPFDLSGKEFMSGYTVPASEANNVEDALKDCGKNEAEKIDNKNGSVTYIFSLCL